MTHDSLSLKFSDGGVRTLPLSQNGSLQLNQVFPEYLELFLMATLPAQIAALQQQITELEDALFFQKEPPKFKVDESAYPALNAVRETLAQAQSAGEQQQLVAQIEQNIAAEKRKLKTLQTELAERQERITTYKQQQAEAFEKYGKLETDLLEQGKLLIGLAQKIAAESEDVSGTTQPVILERRTTELDRKPLIKLDGQGRVLFNTQTTGLIEFRQGEWGQDLHIPDYRFAASDALAAKK